MASSVTQICNLALNARLGQDRIESINEDSAPARAAKEHYAHALAFATEDADYRFARKIATLAQITNDRAVEWTFAYERPSDCLKARYILPYSGRFDPRFVIPYEAMADAIYTDESAARLRYSRLVTDVTRFSPSFTEAVAWYLAHLLVMPLQLDTKLMGDMLNGYQIAKQRAVAADASEELVQQSANDTIPDWQAYR